MPYKKKTGGYCVYKLTSPSGKIYIGSTRRDPRERWNSGYGYFNNKSLFNEIKLYGWLNFSKEVLFDFLLKDEAYHLEANLISQYESDCVEKGFNHTKSGQTGGVFGRHISEKGKKNCSEKNKGIHVGGKSPRAKKVKQYSLSGEYIKTWDATTDVQRELGIHYSNVVKCCTGVYQTAGGYLWKYA